MRSPAITSSILASMIGFVCVVGDFSGVAQLLAPMLFLFSLLFLIAHNRGWAMSTEVSRCGYSGGVGSPTTTADSEDGPMFPRTAAVGDPAPSSSRRLDERSEAAAEREDIR